MRKGLTLISFLFITLNIAIAEISVEANMFYSELNNISSSKTLKAEFQQTNTIKEFGKDNYTGNIYISYGESLLIDYVKPTSQYYLIKGRNLTYYDKATNQATIGELSEDRESIDVFSLLYNLRIIEEQFHLQSYINNTALLIPKSKNNPVQTVEILILNQSIKRIQVTDVSENTIDIEFSNIRKRLKIPQTVYEKQLPKDASIIRIDQ